MNALAIHRDQMNEQSRAGHARGDCSVHTPDQGRDTRVRPGGFVRGGISSRPSDAIVSLLPTGGGFASRPRLFLIQAGRDPRRPHQFCLAHHLNHQVADAREDHVSLSVAVVSMSNHRTRGGAIVRKTLGLFRNE
jgi:hypothetical protein